MAFLCLYLKKFLEEGRATHINIEPSWDGLLNGLRFVFFYVYFMFLFVLFMYHLCTLTPR